VHFLRTVVCNIIAVKNEGTESFFIYCNRYSPLELTLKLISFIISRLGSDILNSNGIFISHDLPLSHH
jgi:hypothetical protein